MNNQSTDLLGEHLRLIVNLLEREQKTFGEIAERIGCSSLSAVKLYNRAKRIQLSNKTYPLYGLSFRIIKVLAAMNINNREELMEALRYNRFRNARNFGWKSYVEIHKWLGLPEPVKPVQY